MQEAKLSTRNMESACRTVGGNKKEVSKAVRLESKTKQLSTTILILAVIITIFPRTVAIHRISPRENLWVTWANKTGQSSFCLSLASAAEPFRTCLLGVPGFQIKDFAKYSTRNCSNSVSVGNCTAELIKGLNQTLSWDPQELDLLGSMRIGDTTDNWTQTCIVFGGPALKDYQYYVKQDWTGWTNVTPHADHYNYDYDFEDKENFCGTNTTYFSRKAAISFGLKATGGELVDRTGIWNNGTPKALPPEVFLICGDRAWQGIPANVYGGPCYFGKLTLLAPGENWWKNITNMTRSNRSKRSSTGLPPDCNDRVTLPSTTERVFLSLFVPGAAAGRALNELGKLACWAEKQAKITTEIIQSLLEDQNSLRHAILQNRAAIDFLLLAQGHGCEDFEGMCCMNLSDHSESIYKQLQWLKSHAEKIQQSHGFMDG